MEEQTGIAGEVLAFSGDSGGGLAWGWWRSNQEATGFLSWVVARSAVTGDVVPDRPSNFGKGLSFPASYDPILGKVQT